MDKKILLRKKRHAKIKMRMQGTAERPRMLVCRSLNNLRVIFVDDTQNKVIWSLSTADKALKLKTGGNVSAAQAFGENCARLAREKGIKEIVFDRGGYLYHGRVKVLAEALRKGGLEF